MRPALTIPAVLLIGMMCAMSAQAQWKWRDADGRVNYSDRPPPASVPASQVTQLDRSGAVRSAPGTSASAAPGQARIDTASAVARDAAAGNGGAADAPAARSWADRAIEARRRQAEKEAAERKAQDQAQAAAGLARACEGARAELRTLESGMRVATVKSDGEREILGDEEREARIQQLSRELRAQCPSS